MAFVMSAKAKRGMAYIFIPAVLLLAALAAYLASGSSIQALPAVPPPQTGDIQRVSISSAGVEGNTGSVTGGISADGRLVVFYSQATNLVANDTNGDYDIFVHDRQTRQTSRVSVTSTGGQANGLSNNPTISANGRFVAFTSAASNLLAGDTNNVSDVYVHDRVTGATTRVSVTSTGGQASPDSSHPDISADGRYVAFQSTASNLVAGDTNNSRDIFVHDRQTGATERVSVSSSEAEAESGSVSFSPSVSADGRYVAFESSATNLVSASDTNNNFDIFVRDRVLGTTIRVSESTSGTQGNAFHGNASISGNGRFVGFRSNSTNLVISDTNGGFSDVFVHDRVTGVTTLVSVDSAGNQGANNSISSSLDHSGRFVAFYGAPDLAPGDANNTHDVMVHDRTTGQTTLMSISTSGQGGNTSSTSPHISANGTLDAFVNINLVAATCNGLAPTIIGTYRADLLVGTAGPDVIMGFFGNDVIQGHNGDDTICADHGSDIVDTGFGNDWVSGGPGPDSINAGIGNDTVRGNGGADGILGGDGDDLLDGNQGNDSLVGEDGDDMLFGGTGNDAIDCGAGSDIGQGGPGADTGDVSCEVTVGIP